LYTGVDFVIGHKSCSFRKKEKEFKFKFFPSRVTEFSLLQYMEKSPGAHLLL
jgi:hypothetical protein